MLRSTLARWLMPAGYSVELAESGRRAREVLAAHPIALTILVRGRSGALALKPEHSATRRLRCLWTLEWTLWYGVVGTQLQPRRRYALTQLRNSVR
jgi:CheY-like chemotaxis protein